MAESKLQEMMYHPGSCSNPAGINHIGVRSFNQVYSVAYNRLLTNPITLLRSNVPGCQGLVCDPLFDECGSTAVEALSLSSDLSNGCREAHLTELPL